jgi:16S rRNA (adenine1518-N6/adenine1519-N6)-dimethyltransferase
MIKPKKSLGQNFLQDRNIARKIVHMFSPNADDTILEIGPGTGILTDLLIGSCKTLIVVEKDIRSVELLRTRYGTDSRISIIHDDILDLSLSGFVGENEKMRVIGNIPYYITTPVLYHLLDRRTYVSDVTMLVQLEAAYRLTAEPSTPDYGILSVLVQTWTTPEILFHVPPSVFYPKPGVTSALIRLVFDRRGTTIRDEALYASIVRGTFGKRRKMLRASLRTLFPDIEPEFDSISVDLRKRPEECAVDEFIQLTDGIYDAFNRERT